LGRSWKPTTTIQADVGLPVSFGRFGYKKTCSSDKIENLYQMTAYMERAGRKYTVTLTKSVCDETMVDLLPGIPAGTAPAAVAKQ
jgi:hypothetical protein